MPTSFSTNICNRRVQRPGLALAPARPHMGCVTRGVSHDDRCTRAD